MDTGSGSVHVTDALVFDIIDEIIAHIRASKNVDDARDGLVSKFGFTEVQAQAIVEMRLRQLTGLERDKLQAEYDELERFIAHCQEILGSEALQMQIIKDECQEMKAKYGDPRRSEITMSAEDFNPEDFYADEDVVITISHLGYIKRTPLTEFRTQARGGVGKKGGSTRDEDFIEHIYVANMHSTMLFFTQKGICYRLKVYELPEGQRASKGRAVQNMLPIEPGDSIKTYLNAAKIEDTEYTDSHFVTLVTKQGVIKKTTLTEYANKRSRNRGLIALSIREGDELLDAVLTNGNEQIMIAARDGRCVRFKEDELRAMGRGASGVRGIRLADEDEVVGVITYDPNAEDASEHTVLVLSEKGLGKRSDPNEYRLTHRGSGGVKTLNITDKTGNVVAIKNVTAANDLMIITQSGLTIRLSVESVKESGRVTQGVKLINLREGDSIAAVSVVSRNEDPEEDASEATAEPSGTETAEQAEQD